MYLYLNIGKLRVASVRKAMKPVTVPIINNWLSWLHRPTAHQLHQCDDPVPTLTLSSASLGWQIMFFYYEANCWF